MEATPTRSGVRNGWVLMPGPMRQVGEAGRRQGPPRRRRRSAAEEAPSPGLGPAPSCSRVPVFCCCFFHGKFQSSTQGDDKHFSPSLLSWS